MYGGAEAERGTGGDADFFLQVPSEDPDDDSHSHVVKAFDFHPEHDVIKSQTIFKSSPRTWALVLKSVCRWVHKSLAEMGVVRASDVSKRERRGERERETFVEKRGKFIRWAE